MNIDKIFEETPASCANYLISAAFEMRRSSLKTQLWPVHPAWGELDNVPTWFVKNIYILGPYEAEAINKIFSMDDPFLIIQGGTGSGKSTFINFLIENLTRSQDGYPWMKNSTDNEIPSHLRCRLPIVVLYPDAPRPPAQKQKDNVAVYAEEFLDGLARRLQAGLYHCGPVDEPYETLIPKLFAEYFWGKNEKYKSLPQQQSIDAIAANLKLHIGHNKDAWLPTLNSQNYNEHLRKIVEAINKLPSALERFGAWLIPYAALATTTKSFNVPYLIVIDNIDQYEIEVQSEVYQGISALVRGTNLERVGLRFITTMRMSSSMNIINAHPELKPASHYSPIPSDLITIKTAEGILEAAEEGVEKQESLLLSELLGHLTDRKSTFPEILSAISGSNIRIAYHIAKQWCNSPIVIDAIKKASTDRDISQFNDSLLESYCRFFLKAMANRIGEAAIQIAKISLTARSPENLADEILDSISLIIKDSRMFAVGYDKGAIRCRFGSKIGVYAANVISENGNFIRESFSSLKVDFCHAFSVLRSKTAQGFVEQVVESFDDVVTRDPKLDFVMPSDKEGERRAVLLENVSHTIAYFMNEAIMANYTTDEIEATRRGHGNIVPSDGHEHTVLNTHLASRVLLELEIQEGTPIAVNIFGQDGHLSTIGLRIIYALSLAKENKLRWRDIDITLAGFKENESPIFTERNIKDVVEKFIHRQRRLIYSGIADYELGANTIMKKDDATVGLSWAGLSYFKDLSKDIFYFRWCLGQVFRSEAGEKAYPPAKNDSIYVELDRCQAILAYDAERELKIFNYQDFMASTDASHIWGDNVVRVLYPLIDVYSRLLFSALQLISSGFKGVSARSKLQLSSLANRWSKNYSDLLDNAEKSGVPLHQEWRLEKDITLDRFDWLLAHNGGNFE